MGTRAIENLSDAELQELATRAQEMLQQRKGARRLEAVEQARAILADVGLSFQEAEKLSGAARTKKPAAAKPQSRKGQRFVNPADPGQVWESGRGRKPKWLAALEARGEAPQPA